MVSLSIFLLPQFMGLAAYALLDLARQGHIHRRVPTEFEGARILFPSFPQVSVKRSRPSLLVVAAHQPAETCLQTFSPLLPLSGRAEVWHMLCGVLSGSRF